jgi:hypothetical protein
MTAADDHAATGRIIAAGAVCLPLGVWLWQRRRGPHGDRRAWWLVPLTLVPPAAAWALAFAGLPRAPLLFVLMTNALGLVGVTVLVFWRRGRRAPAALLAAAGAAGLAVVGLMARVVTAGGLDAAAAWIVVPFAGWTAALLLLVARLHETGT